MEIRAFYFKPVQNGSSVKYQTLILELGVTPQKIPFWDSGQSRNCDENICFYFLESHPEFHFAIFIH